MADTNDVVYRIGADTSDGQQAVKDFSAFTVAKGQLIADAFKAVGEAAVAALKKATDAGMAFEASMSQVAATMGTTVDQITELSDIAKEMGATTKFTATEAGDALNYLALAGYDAEKQIAALPVVLNLAAAGGMDLARASDMVTDSMSALGIATEDLANFSDQMAKTAQKSNTSVAQLGDGMLTVGGTAKILKGGVTELNTALGILADNGIKASEGGTGLRQVLLNLTTPTSTAADQLDALGVKVYDFYGDMRGLNEIFADLDTAMAGFTDGQRMQAMSDIFDARTLKSANALMANYGERWDELSGYISDADSACADMAKTMNDNLKGDVTILNSALEGLGITVSDTFNDTFRKAVKTASDEISKINESMTDGEMQESMQKISDAFAELSEELVTFLAEDVLPAAIKGFEWIVDHGDGIKTAIVGVGTAFLAYKAITGVINSVTAAQAALNAVMALNPAVAITAAIVALTAALATYVSSIETAAEKTERLSDDYERQTEKVDKLTEKYKDNQEKVKELNALKTDKSITAAQEDELKRLQDQTSELASQLDLEKELLVAKKKLAGEAALEQAYEEGNSTAGNLFNIAVGELTNNPQYAINKAAEDTSSISIPKMEGMLSQLEESSRRVTEAGEAASDEAIATAESQRRMVLASVENLTVLRDELDTTTEEGQQAFDTINGLLNKAYELTGIAQKAEESDTAGSIFDPQSYYSKYAAAEKARADKTANAYATLTANRKDAFEKAQQQLQDEYDFGVIAEDEYYTRLEALLSRYTDNERGEYKEYFLDIRRYRADAAKDAAAIQDKQLKESNETLEAHMSAIKKLADGYQTELEKVKDKQEDIKKSASSVGGMFDFGITEEVTQSDPNRMDRTVVRSGGVSGAAKAMKNRISDIRKFTDGIKQLKAKGVPAGVISEILSMGFEEGLGAINSLQSASMAELMDYSAVYTELQRQSEQLSTDMVSSQASAIEAAFDTTLQEYISALPEEFRQAGVDSMAAYARGVSQAGVSLMENIAFLSEGGNPLDLVNGAGGGIGMGAAAIQATPTSTAMSTVDLSPVTSAVSAPKTSAPSGTLSVSVPVMLDGVQLTKVVAKNINLESSRTGGNTIL